VYWKIRRTGKLFPHAAVRVRVKIKDRVKVRVRVRSRFKITVRVRVGVTYIMTIWRWEEFSRCDKFPTTPALPLLTANCKS